MRMLFEKGVLYKFEIDKGNEKSLYTAEVIKEDENFITIKDKYNSEIMIRKISIITSKKVFRNE